MKKRCQCKIAPRERLLGEGVVLLQAIFAGNAEDQTVVGSLIAISTGKE